MIRNITNIRLEPTSALMERRGITLGSIDTARRYTILPPHAVMPVNVINAMRPMDASNITNNSENLESHSPSPRTPPSTQERGAETISGIQGPITLENLGEVLRQIFRISVVPPQQISASYESPRTPATIQERGAAFRISADSPRTPVSSDDSSSENQD